MSVAGFSDKLVAVQGVNMQVLKLLLCWLKFEFSMSLPGINLLVFSLSVGMRSFEAETLIYIRTLIKTLLD